MKQALLWILITGAVVVLVFLVTGRGQRTTVTLGARTESSGGVDTSPSDTASDGAGTEGAASERTYEIVTLLPKDAIPAVYTPRFLDATAADQQYQDTDLVIGVEIDGNARAYNIPFLSGHEIVNDTVGGRKIAVTW